MFKERTCKPESGNKYYITKDSGGWSPCIKGKPTDKDCNVLSNCVGYAVGRFNEIHDRKCCDLLGSRNAGLLTEFCKPQGLLFDSSTPHAGAVMVWQKKNGAGHCAVVEKVVNENTVITSESGYNSKVPWWRKERTRGNGNWGCGSAYTFMGFIYKEDVKNMVKMGSVGEDVKKIQIRLKTLGYFESLCDGYFGKKTLGAVLAYQKLNGLAVDGIVGKNTLKSLRLN